MAGNLFFRKAIAWIRFAIRDKFGIVVADEMIVKNKEELDDFVDSLELLSNPRFRKNLERGLKEALS